MQSTLDEIRQLRDTLGPSAELIEAVGPALKGLALQEDLFDAETFAVDAGALMTIYELSVDLDGRLGLYASAGMPRKQQPPHDHRTWSVIAGVRGAEHNQYFGTRSMTAATHSGDGWSPRVSAGSGGATPTA